MSKNNKSIIDEKVKEITKQDTLNDNFIENSLTNENVINQILRDTLDDNKKEGSKKSTTIWLLILTFVGYIFYSQWNITNIVKENDIRFKDFLSQFGFEDNINQNLQVDGNSTVTDVNKIDN